MLQLASLGFRKVPYFSLGNFSITMRNIFGIKLEFDVLGQRFFLFRISSTLSLKSNFNHVIYWPCFEHDPSSEDLGNIPTWLSRCVSIMKRRSKIPLRSCLSPRVFLQSNSCHLIVLIRQSDHVIQLSGRGQS